jgi:hypothetical protein
MKTTFPLLRLIQTLPNRIRELLLALSQEVWLAQCCSSLPLRCSCSSGGRREIRDIVLICLRRIMGILKSPGYIQRNLGVHRAVCRKLMGRSLGRLAPQITPIPRPNRKHFFHLLHRRIVRAHREHSILKKLVVWEGKDDRSSSEIR